MRPFASPQDLALRARLDQREMQQLAAADALASLAGHRRQQVWQATALRAMPALLHGAAAEEDALDLPAAPESEEVLWGLRLAGPDPAQPSAEDPARAAGPPGAC